MNTERGNKNTFWRSPAGVVFGVFLCAAAFLLVLEHGAHILGASPLLLILAACVGMHFFMHGGHGSHGSKKDDDHAGHSHGGDDER